jgi:hypothetical protein
LAADIMTLLPVAMEPVKLIFSMPGCSVIIGPSLSSPFKHWRTPGGRYFWAISANLSAEYGVKGEGFTITVLPVKRPGTIFCVDRMRGKFHGQMAPTTPSGT